MSRQIKISYREALLIWIKVALYSFGGPAGQIAVMHKLLVEQKKWISERRFLFALNYCMLLPGPEAQQLATYIGWLLHNTKGGLTAGILFILPGFLSILLLSILYVSFNDVILVQALFFGIKPAVLAIVIGAVIKIGKRVIKNHIMLFIAVASFIALFFYNVHFPLIIILAGIVGFAGGYLSEEKFYLIKGHKADTTSGEINETHLHYEKTSLKKSVLLIFFFILIWFFPIVLIRIFTSPENIFITEGLFFSKAAVLTFGGAYSVLAYVSQQAVDIYQWLLPGEMLDGLGMAETTPGPLIQVVQFVGFMGAYRFPGALEPMTAAIIGSVVVTWVTFVPCFLFIFVGAPYMEKLRGNKKLSSVLSAITAAVVGVILNLGIWFSIHVIFQETIVFKKLGMNLVLPILETIDVAALIITIIAFILYFVLKLNMLKIIGICVASGIFYYLIF